jgi:hypothetical protein
MTKADMRLNRKCAEDGFIKAGRDASMSMEALPEEKRPAFIAELQDYAFEVRCKIQALYAKYNTEEHPAESESAD